jgi:predicted HicB family RNase H-like nuclease
MIAESVALTGMVKRKITQINMRIEPELKALAEKAAAADRRSLSALISKLLEDYLKKHGFLKPERRR